MINDYFADTKSRSHLGDFRKNIYNQSTNNASMNPKAILLFMLCLLPIGTTAYIHPDYSGPVPVKDYLQDGSLDQCMAVLKSIPSEYYEGIRVIRILPKHRLYSGFYWLGGVIDLYDNCDQEVIYHELAHHCQFNRKDPLYKLMYHEGNFSECLILIRYRWGLD